MIEVRGRREIGNWEDLSISISELLLLLFLADGHRHRRAQRRSSIVPRRRPPCRGPSPFLINLLTGRRNVCSFIFVSICACWHFSGVDLKKWRDKGQRSFLPAQNKTVHRPNDKVCLPMQRSDDAIKNHVGPSLHPSAGICLLAKLPTHR